MVDSYLKKYKIESTWYSNFLVKTQLLLNLTSSKLNYFQLHVLIILSVTQIEPRHPDGNWLQDIVPPSTLGYEF